MRSGIFGEPAYEDRYWDPVELILATNGRAAFAPDQMYQYSNPNFWILGYIVEKLSGIPGAEYINTRIVPASLNHTSIPADKQYDMIYGYHNTPLGSIEFHKYYDPSYPWTAGAIVGTAGDQAMWHLELFSTKSVVSESSLLRMTETYSDSVYGNGLMHIHEMICVQDQLTIYGHSGGYPGFTSLNGYIVQHDAAVTLGINESGGSSYATYMLLYRKLLIDLGYYNPELTPKDIATTCRVAPSPVEFFPFENQRE